MFSWLWLPCFLWFFLISLYFLAVSLSLLWLQPKHATQTLSLICTHTQRDTHTFVCRADVSESWRWWSIWYYSSSSNLRWYYLLKFLGDPWPFHHVALPFYFFSPKSKNFTIRRKKKSSDFMIQKHFIFSSSFSETENLSFSLDIKRYSNSLCCSGLCWTMGLISWGSSFLFLSQCRAYTYLELGFSLGFYICIY